MIWIQFRRDVRDLEMPSRFDCPPNPRPLPRTGHQMVRQALVSRPQNSSPECRPVGAISTETARSCLPVVVQGFNGYRGVIDKQCYPIETEDSTCRPIGGRKGDDVHTTHPPCFALLWQTSASKEDAKCRKSGFDWPIINVLNEPLLVIRPK